MKNNAIWITSDVLTLARIPTVTMNAEGFSMAVSMIVHATLIVQMDAMVVPILFVSVAKIRHLKIKII